jgi:FkbM family methyltransferase
MIDKYKIDSNIYEVKTFYGNESAYFKTFDDCFISNEVKKGMIWEPNIQEVFENYIKKDWVVIDGGAHIGIHTIKLSKLADKVYAFEPMRASYDLLRENIKLNGCTNVRLDHRGLSSNKGTSTWAWISKDNISSSGLKDNSIGEHFNREWYPTEEEQYEVDLISIDELNLNKVDFIKLDLEGYERKAIDGCKETIKRCRPMLLIESWKDHRGTVDIDFTKDLYRDLIEEHSYKISQVGIADYLFY